ncbi:MAG: PaREP1 family protein [Thermofilum sp.]|nr:PaREP1 family protein [Thermofilum sp.]
MSKNPLSSGLAVTALEEAKRALELASRELVEFRRERDSLRLRDACEKGWLAVLLATDALLAELGLGKPESYSERGALLRELERKMPKVVGLRDRLGARGYYLHILGYHEGSLREDEVTEELEKARKYIEDVENLLKEQNPSRNLERIPTLEQIGQGL